MKTTFYVLFFSLFFYSATNSQIIWNSQNSGTYENLNDIVLIDANTGYIAGNNGKVLKTTNAGVVWTAKSFPVYSKNNCLFFMNSQTGFIGNEDYNIYKTTDGGNSWTSKLTAASYPVTSIFFTSATNGFLGDHSGKIQKTSNGGDNWFILTDMPGYDSKMYFINDMRGWSVDTYGYVYTTTNSGASFSSLRISNDTLSSVYFISSTLGFAAGDSGRVFKTTNGGTNWLLLNTGTSVNLKSIYAENSNIVFAAGKSGIVIYSFNDGGNWTVETHGTNNFNGMNFLPGTLTGSISGDLGTIIRTYNMGISCAGSGNLQEGYPFYTYFMDSRTDMLFTASELISNGIESGQIWQIGFDVVSVGGPAMNGFNIKFQHTSLTSLSNFVNTGWTTAYSGTYTVQATGMQYINLSPPQFIWNGTDNLLIEICFNNSAYTVNSIVNSTPAPNMTFHNHADLGSGNGCVDITTGTVQANRPNICFQTQMINGANNSSSIIPEKYSLSQNYPNPFNPATRIKYGIPKNSYVTLKIYDLLGKELKTLVNDQLKPGEYIADFNASDLSSGIYFYTIKTDGFTETKKMILLK